jgi:hypothetical protein
MIGTATVGKRDTPPADRGLEVALDGALTRSRGTSQRFRMVLEDLADIRARFDPTSGTRRLSDGEGEIGVEMGGQGRKRRERVLKRYGQMLTRGIVSTGYVPLRGSKVP